jgi:hypothetical protein
MNTPFDPPTGEPVTSSASGHQPGRRNRRNTAIGVGAGLLGGGAIGLLMAMPSFTSAATSDATDTTIAVVDTATEETVSDDTVTQETVSDEQRVEPAARIREALQPLVDDATITAEQADAVASRLAEDMPGRGGHGGPGHHGRGGPGFDGEVVAGLLGIDVETLRSELLDGSTIAEIAAAHGVEAQTVIDSLVAEAASHLDLSVANGRLTQEEADAKLAEITTRITDRVNNGRPERGADDGSADAAAG